MNSKTRMLKAWNFEEPDRVPIEMRLSPGAQGLPGADEITGFEKNEADNFMGAPGFDWGGLMGLDSDYTEEIIEDVPGEFRRMSRTHSTSAGKFTAVTKHLYDDLNGGDPSDFHWEKRFFETIDDLKRFIAADRGRRPFKTEEYNRRCAEIGNRGLPGIGLFHPMGNLVRNSNMGEVYMWMATETDIILKFQEICSDQICDSLQAIKNEKLSEPPVFMTYALEMLIPPWLGKTQFNKLIFPFDRRVNDAIHAMGGRHRAHCHGNSSDFLEVFADMGIDGLEPLEPPPYANNNLADAKKRVGKRMLLAGNIPAQIFYMDSFKPSNVRDMVRQAITEGAPGGGFFLRTTGGSVGNGKNHEQRIKSMDCGRAMIEAWREFCSY